MKIFYNGSGFTAGTYRVELYTEGRLIGQADVAMRLTPSGFAITNYGPNEFSFGPYLLIFALRTRRDSARLVAYRLSSMRFSTTVAEISRLAASGITIERGLSITSS